VHARRNDRGALEHILAVVRARTCCVVTNVRSTLPSEGARGRRGQRWQVHAATSVSEELAGASEDVPRASRLYHARRSDGRGCE